MTEASKQGVVNAQVAQDELDIDVRARHLTESERDLYRTIATEPKRIAEAERRGAVKALRDAAAAEALDGSPARVFLRRQARLIERGEDL